MQTGMQTETRFFRWGDGEVGGGTRGGGGRASAKVKKMKMTDESG